MYITGPLKYAWHRNQVTAMLFITTIEIDKNCGLLLLLLLFSYQYYQDAIIFLSKMLWKSWKICKNYKTKTSSKSLVLLHLVFKSVEWSIAKNFAFNEVVLLHILYRINNCNMALPQISQKFEITEAKIHIKWIDCRAFDVYFFNYYFHVKIQSYWS